MRSQSAEIIDDRIGKEILTGRTIIPPRCLHPTPPKETFVKITWKDHRFLGYADNIGVRILCIGWDIEEHVKKTLEECRTFREKILGYRNMYRLVYSDADKLSGLIIDVYGDAAVVKYSSKWVESIGLTEILLNDYRTVVDRTKGEIYGEERRYVTCEEHGIKYIVDIVKGQKTGFYLDQKDNRLLCREYFQGRSVLDCFSYTGAFALNAWKAGAEEVFAVEKSAEAFSLLMKNVEINNADVKCIREDVIKFLSESRRPFDVVILDPPRLDQPKKKAIEYLYMLHRYAIKRLSKEGYLITFCCTYRVKDKELLRVAAKAASAEGRSVKVVRILGQARDHPISPYNEHLSYLKGFILYIS